jgi:NADH:ubiquinone oxidoreductase subunit 5 (subunit L)/multisubunit Na+/H+ antiporter MnhA subunit
MSLVIVLAVVGALAYLVGKVWVVAVPPAIGFLAAGAIIGVGAQLNDTPLPIAIVVATAAAAFGIVVRHQPSARRVSP